jgi:hypothetical protein
MWKWRRWLMFFPASGWFAAFALTLAVEAAIVVVLLHRAEPSRVRLGFLVLFANLATHPLVWYVFTQLFLVGTVEYVLVAETWAVAAEAVFYTAAIRGLSARRALGVAVTANAASFMVGRVIGPLWPELFR